MQFIHTSPQQCSKEMFPKKQPGGFTGFSIWNFYIVPQSIKAQKIENL